MANDILPPSARIGRERAIKRLNSLVKRDAKRGDYEKVNQWLDMIQFLEETEPVYEGSVN